MAGGETTVTWVRERSERQIMPKEKGPEERSNGVLIVLEET
jgi:hypothetical protein